MPAAKLTKELTDRIAAQIIAGELLRDICEVEGLASGTLYGWRRGRFPKRTDPELTAYFTATVEAAERTYIDDLTAAFFNARNEREASKPAWILIRRFPEAWKDVMATRLQLAELSRLERELEAQLA